MRGPELRPWDRFFLGLLLAALVLRVLVVAWERLSWWATW